jgi:hypothetical protein
MEEEKKCVDCGGTLYPHEQEADWCQECCDEEFPPEEEEDAGVSYEDFAADEDQHNGNFLAEEGEESICGDCSSVIDRASEVIHCQHCASEVCEQCTENGYCGTCTDFEYHKAEDYVDE